MDAAIRSTFVYYYRGASRTLFFFIVRQVYFLNYRYVISTITKRLPMFVHSEIQLFRNF